MIDEALGHRILALWKDKKFFGSFSGVRNFQSALKHEANINVNQHDLYQLMYRQNPTYVSMIKQVNKFPRRKYTNVHGFLTLCQADLGFLPSPDDSNLIGFLVVVDVFSRHMWTENITSKSNIEVKACFEKIWKKIGRTPNKLETDAVSYIIIIIYFNHFVIHGNFRGFVTIQTISCVKFILYCL